MPSSSSTRYFQPKAVALLTSSSLRGVPLGRVVGAGDDIGVALALELANYRATHHAPVACNVYF